MITRAPLKRGSLQKNIRRTRLWKHHSKIYQTTTKGNRVFLKCPSKLQMREHRIRTCRLNTPNCQPFICKHSPQFSSFTPRVEGESSRSHVDPTLNTQNNFHRCPWNEGMKPKSRCRRPNFTLVCTVKGDLCKSQSSGGNYRLNNHGR